MSSGNIATCPEDSETKQLCGDKLFAVQILFPFMTVVQYIF